MAASPSLLTPPLDVPRQIDFTDVTLGVAAFGDGGNLFKFDGSVVARIDGDDAGVFSITGLETDRLMRDPELPPGTPPQWQTLRTVDGSGPIDASGAQALIVTVSCSCPIGTQQDSFTASALITPDGTDGAVLMNVPITATVDGTGRVSIVSVATPPILPGDTLDMQFSLRSTVLDPVNGTFRCAPDNGEPFSSPARPASVPARVQGEQFSDAQVTVPVTCNPGTAPGFFDQVLFRFDSVDDMHNADYRARLEVLPPRAIWTTTSIPLDVSVAPGVPVACQITVNESGGTSPIEIVPAPFSEAISLTLGALTSDVGGTGGNDRTNIQDIVFKIKGGTPAGTQIPLEFDWAVPADDTHPATTGSVIFNITVLPPEEITFEQQVLTPSGTALGGTASLTIRSDGTYTFTTSMRDSGLDSYTYQVRAALTTAAGAQLMAQYTGTVSGTLGSGSREDDHSEAGDSPWLYDNWLDARTATLSLNKSYHDAGIIGVGEAALDALLEFVALEVVAGPVLGAVIMLGEELTSVTGIEVFGPGGLPGVIVAAGTAWLLGPDMVLSALVAGVAAGAVTDALVMSRRMDDAEIAFADAVFTGQIQYDRVWLTNLSNGHRKFTWPSPDGSILVNLGDAYLGPTLHTESSYPDPGQVFIHELTHAWQITHSSFTPGLTCDRIVDPSYDYGPPGPPFALFTVEGQAEIVDDWFGGHRQAQSGRPPGKGTGMDQNDPYFPYIVNNIRSGDD